MSWDGTFKNSNYNTDSFEKDILNYIDYGVLYAKELSGGGVEVMEERSDGTSRLNIYGPDGRGGHTHDWVDSNGKTYHRH